MSRNKPQPVTDPPDLAEIETFAAFDGDALVAGRDYRAMVFDDCRFDRSDLRELVFDSVLLRTVSLGGSRGLSLTVTDSRLTGCDLANARWTGAGLLRTELINCRLTGFDGSEARFRHVRFVASKCDLSVFHSARFECCRFENCDLRGADFDGADLRGTVFAGCDLTDARMHGAKLVGTDFRGAQVRGLSLERDALRGAVIEPVQLVDFAGLLGVTVKPPDDTESL
jgi:uncharacterized protein YjbI with pentapeptide repeats